MNSYQTNTTPDYHNCAIAHFSFMYLYRPPDDGRSNERPQDVQDSNNKRTSRFRVLCSCGSIANGYLARRDYVAQTVRIVYCIT